MEEGPIRPFLHSAFRIRHSTFGRLPGVVGGAVRAVLGAVGADVAGGLVVDPAVAGGGRALWADGHAAAGRDVADRQRRDLPQVGAIDPAQARVLGRAGRAADVRVLLHLRVERGGGGVEA